MTACEKMLSMNHIPENADVFALTGEGSLFDAMSMSASFISVLRLNASISPMDFDYISEFILQYIRFMGKEFDLLFRCRLL